MGSRVIIKQMSNLSGFSVSTVSKALNDRSDVSPKVKDKIKSLAESVNYIPNSFATTLRFRKTNIIAIIVPHISSAYYANLVSEMQHTASEKGYRIIILQSMTSSKRELKCIHSVNDGSIDGLIIFRTELMLDSEFHQNLALLNSSSVPNVIFKIDSEDLSVSNVNATGNASFKKLLSKMTIGKNGNHLK